MEQRRSLAGRWRQTSRSRMRDSEPAVSAFVARPTLDSVHFHVALAFDRALDVHVEGYPLPDVLTVLEVEPGKRYPVAALPADIEFTDLPSA